MTVHELRDGDTIFMGAPCETNAVEYCQQMKSHFARRGVDVHVVVLLEAPQVITVVRAIPTPTIPPPPSNDELQRIEAVLRRHPKPPSSSTEYRALATQIALELKGLA